MIPEEKKLVRHLIIAVVVKIVLLVILWFVFVRDARLKVDSEQLANKFNKTEQSKGESK